MINKRIFQILSLLSIFFLKGSAPNNFPLGAHRAIIYPAQQAGEPPRVEVIFDSAANFSMNENNGMSYPVKGLQFLNPDQLQVFFQTMKSYRNESLKNRRKNVLIATCGLGHVMSIFSTMYYQKPLESAALSLCFIRYADVYSKHYFEYFWHKKIETDCYFKPREEEELLASFVNQWNAHFHPFNSEQATLILQHQSPTDLETGVGQNSTDTP